MKKKTAAIFLALAFVLGTGNGAVAATNNEVISATLNRSTKVVYNGVEQCFVDAKGNPVYPIAYNGNIYLPVRATANMVGIQNSNIKYDGTLKILDSIFNRYLKDSGTRPRSLFVLMPSL